MNPIAGHIEPWSVHVLEEVVIRFVDAARMRSDRRVEPKRRSRQRYHRSWPLSVIFHDGQTAMEHTVALHNASLQGLAFLSPLHLEPGMIVYVRLFWYDDACPRVPAVVRHSTATKTGYLVGCEFVLWEDPDLLDDPDTDEFDRD
jgi:hypothetical protein